jgi:RHS repeat-associated protein
VWNEREHDAANQITSIPGGITPAYDAAGNMTSGPKPGEAAGDGQTGQNYTYDAWNRLVKVEEWIWTDSNEDGEFQAGEKSTAVPVAEYQYDGLNRRIAKLIFDAPSDTWTRTDSYFNEAWQVLEERVAAAVYAADKGQVATDASVQYLWDPRYIDTPILRWRDADPNVAGLEEVLYYTTDANFNVTALIHEGTGDVAERYVYDAYGTVTVLNADWSTKGQNVSGFDNNRLYAGAPLDRETGLILMRRRYYDPSLGVFTSKDPIGRAGGNANLYGYASSNPVTRVDPMGLSSIETEEVHVAGKGTYIHYYDKGWLTHTFLGTVFVEDSPWQPNNWSQYDGLRLVDQLGGNPGGPPSWGMARWGPVRTGAAYAEGGMRAFIALNPISGVGELATGKSFVTDEDLDATGYVFAGASILPIGKAFGVAKKGLDIAKMSKALKGAGIVLRKLPVDSKVLEKALELAQKGDNTELKRILLQASRSRLPQKQVKFFSSLDALKAELGPAGQGKVWHHIVEQRDYNVEKFGAEAIHNTQNVVPVPADVIATRKSNVIAGGAE